MAQMYVYASELRKFWHFYILNLLFLSIFCRYNRYFVGTNGVLVGLHVPTNFQIYERAERASLENFGIFTFLNCYFFQYFVGTSDTLSVQMTCLSAHMYRQIFKCTDKNLKKHYWGGSCPPAPPLATLMGCPKKSGTLDFRYFDIRKFSIFWFHQIKHCLLKRMILRSVDLVR